MNHAANEFPNLWKRTSSDVDNSQTATAPACSLAQTTPEKTTLSKNHSATPEHDDPEHEPLKRRPPLRQASLDWRADSVCTRSVSLASTSGFVSGSTPWPRLKICPSAVRPRPRAALARASTTSHGAS